MISSETSTLYSEILRRLAAARKKENSLALLYGAMTAFLISILLILIIVVLDQIFLLNSFGRTILFVAGAIGIVASIAFFCGRPLLRVAGILKSSDNETMAQTIGKFFPVIRDRLIDAIQMYQAKESLQQNYSLALIDASFVDLFRQIQGLNFSDAISSKQVYRMRKFVFSAFALFLLVFVISPSGFLASFYRIANYGQTFATPQPIEFDIQPGNAEVVRGQNVPVTIQTHGKIVNTISLCVRQHGQLNFDVQILKAESDGKFQSTMENIKSSTEYFVSAEDVQSPKYNITVLDRPLIRSLQLKIHSPAYTRIPPNIPEENIGDLSAYPGSAVSIKIISSKSLSSAMLMFNDSSKLSLASNDAEANGSFTVMKSRSYHIVITDKDHLPNIDPVEYTMKIIPDEYPTVDIIAPGKNTDLTGEMAIDVLMRLKDDFGFSKLRLAYRLAESKFAKPAEEFSFIDIPLSRKDVSLLDVPYHWDVTSLNLVPEDAVEYYAEVFDNDNVKGPKSGKSETYILRLPSLEEVFSDVSENHQQSIESMQSAAKETEQLKKDIEQMQMEMKKNQNKADWQQQKKAEELAQRYEAMKKNLESATQKLDETMKKMEENKLLSNETMEKYSELQKLMQQLSSPELQEALKKLQESSKQLSSDQMRQAMEQLKISEEQFRTNLERTIELLKRIHIEQKVDELIKRAEEMKKEQETLKDQASKTNPSDQQKRDALSKQQEDLQQKEQSLEKETSELKQQMEEFPKEMPMDKMSKVEQQMQQKQTGSKMQKAAQQMQSGDMQQAKQNQEQSEQDLQDFTEQMQDMQKSLQDEQMKQVANQFRKQIQNMVELSKRQESLKEGTRNLDPNSQRFRQNAEDQNDLRSDLGTVADAMGELGKKTFAVTPEMGNELGKAMKAMNDALQNMESRNPSASSSKQNDAMGSLNRAAMMMQNALNGLMQNQQQGMGMAGLMGSLSQMSGQQGAINKGTQQAMGEGQEGGQLTPEQQAAYQRLAGQQSALQKSLKQLSEEAKNTGEFSKLLGDLDRAAQEMQEVQTDLEQNNVNPNTVQKQDRILSRLLDSQRSMRERDYEKRRTSQTGNNVPRSSPTDIDLTTQEGKNKLHDELLKVLEGKYSKDYEEIIKQYFEELEKEEVKQ